MVAHTHTLIDDTNKLNLKIVPHLQKPPKIEDYHVPIFTCTKEDIHDITWDLTIEQVMIMDLAKAWVGPINFGKMVGMV